MPSRASLFRSLALAALLVISPHASGGQIRRVSTADGLHDALSAARGGDVILLAPGEYRGYFAGDDLHASEEQPTIIGAADPKRPPVLHGLKECLHLSRVSHLVVRDLVLAGATVNGLNIDDGDVGDPEAPATHHIVVENVVVRDIGPSGNKDGIKLSGLDDFLITGCAVERWGTKGSAVDMVGCHRGLIANCLFRSETNRGFSGVQVKGGSSEVCIARCQFREAGLRAVNMGGSTGLPYFRPPDAGCEARDVLTIGNVFFGSKAPIAFVGADSCEASYNTLIHPRRWVLRILQESRGDRFVPSRNGLFRRNLAVWRYRDLLAATNVGPATDPQSFRFEANWWFCEDRPAHSTPLLPVEDSGGRTGTDPEFSIQGSSVSAVAAPEHGAHAPAAETEFRRRALQMAPWAFRQFIGRTGNGPER